MPDQSKARDLFAELWADPEAFDEAGKAHELLQEYFRGLPLETLRPLLKDESTATRRAGAFIASELGSAALALVDDICPLTEDPDPHIRWCAIESVMVCSRESHHDRFMCILRQLETAEGPLLRLAMRLIGKANREQLAEGLEELDRNELRGEDHGIGIAVLLAGETADEETILGLLDHHLPLLRAYAVVAASRLSETSPALLEAAAKNRDPTIARFALEHSRAIGA